MASDLPYLHPDDLRRMYRLHRHKQNTHKMRADAIQAEIQRRASTPTPEALADYEAYFSRCEAANRVPLTFDEWLAKIA